MKTWRCRDDTPYFNLTNNLCQDDCGLYYYENTTVLQCYGCAFGCAQCINSTSCLNCDTAADHRFLGTVDGVKTCVCQEGYFEDSTHPKATACLSCIQNCGTCADSETCQLCMQHTKISQPNSPNEINEGTTIDTDGQSNYNWFVLASNLTCIDCGYGCSTCTDESVCTGCTIGYLNMTTNLCQSNCAVYFFADDTSTHCEQCPFACFNCTDANTCLDCNQDDLREMVHQSGVDTCLCPERFHQDAYDALNTVCQPCIHQCLTCQNPDTCIVCNEAIAYLLIPNETCQFCGYGCNQCNDELFCLSCKEGFLYNNTDGSCSCPSNQYKELSDITCRPCSDRCLTCDGESEYECTSCHSNQNRQMVRLRYGLVQCVCIPFNYIEAPDGNPQCIMATEQSCDYGYIYLKDQGRCLEICGDGLNYGMFECDDGNQLDGDGCSSQCQVQQGFECSLVVGITASSCHYIGQVVILSSSTYKSPLTNSLTIEGLLKPIEPFFYWIDWNDGLVVQGADLQLLDSYIEGKKLVIKLNYFEDLSGKLLTIKYSSQAARDRLRKQQQQKGTTKRMLYKRQVNQTDQQQGLQAILPKQHFQMQSQQKESKQDSEFERARSQKRLLATNFTYDLTMVDYPLYIEPFNSLQVDFFDSSIYNIADTAHTISLWAALIVLLFVLASLCLKTPFAVLQLTLGLQLVFLSVGVLSSLHPVLAAITQFSPIKGPKSSQVYFQGWTNQGQPDSYNVRLLGYVSSFFANNNILIFLQIAMAVMAGALNLLSKKDLRMRDAFKLCQRQLLLLVFFSAMNLNFSAGLLSFSGNGKVHDDSVHDSSNGKDDISQSEERLYPFEVATAALALGALGYQTYYFLRNLRMYYGMDDTFYLRNDNTKKIKLFVGILLAIRVLSAFAISLFRKQTLASCLMVFFLQLPFAIGFSYLRPYIRSLTNKLLIFAEWIVLLFLCCNIIVKFNLNGTEDGSGQLIVSLIQLSVAYMLAILIIIVFLYCLYYDHCAKQKIQPRINLNSPVMEEKSSMQIKDKDRGIYEDQKQHNHLSPSSPRSG